MPERTDDHDVPPTIAIDDRPELERYELTLDGRLAGVATYRLDADEDRITLLHTEIAPAGRGLGLGSRLAEHVLADIRRRGLRIQADCEFMAEHIATHPEHQDLLV